MRSSPMRWMPLSPPLHTQTSIALLSDYGRKLSRLKSTAESEDGDGTLHRLRGEFIEAARACPPDDRHFLLAAGLVLSDLVAQGWPLRVLRGVVQVTPPLEVVGDVAAEKHRVRRQELVKRDAQLRQPAVQRFIRSMERMRLQDGRFVSIFSVIRDGRALADALREARVHSDGDRTQVLATLVDPYLQFVTSESARCPVTGLRLMDVWRYFRHTWTNQYTSVPGRSMAFIVRDRAAPCHPVIGIGALSSPIVQIRERDTWIGWHPSTFLAAVRANPTEQVALWLNRILEDALQEIYVGDFLEEGLLSAHSFRDPDENVVGHLLAESVEQRRAHHRYVRSRDHKQSYNIDSEADRWVSRARTHLFRSKRALALAELLRARILLRRYFVGRPSAAGLGQLASTAAGSNAIRKILRKAKADRIGIAVADISVCGAVQPYNAILGGKLVAMLAASPEVVMEYGRRYSRAESEIASAMAGRAIVRASKLVLLGTTSLYGVGSSQYNRIKIPCGNDVIRFEELGHSEAFGTSQYSDETVAALVRLVQQSANGQRVNSIFGEGVSPKLRKVREGLDLLNFPSDSLLKHHRHRVVYGVSLIRNLRNYLLGMDAEPDYFMRPEDGPAATASIAAWWRDRWLSLRIRQDPVLEEVAAHTLVRPVRHGARVNLPADATSHVSVADEPA